MKDRIIAKILIPIILMILLSLSIVTICFISFTQKTVANQIENDSTQKLDILVNQFSSAQNELKRLTNALNEKNVVIVKLISELLYYDPSLKETSNLESMAKEFGVSEIHIADSEGILKYGTIKEFLGFNYEDTEQSIPFLDLLVDDFSVLVQSIQPRGVDGKLFQYIGCSTKGEKGFIQIGLEANEIQSFLRKFDLQIIINDYIKNNTESYAFIVDMDNSTIMYHPEHDKIGLTLLEYNKELESLLKTERNDLNLGSLYYYSIVNKQYKYILVTDSERYYKTYYQIYRVVASVLILLLFSLIVLISILIENGVVKNILAVSENLKEVTDGGADLTKVITLKTRDEVYSLVNRYNDFVSKLKSIVVGIKKSSQLNDNVVASLNTSSSYAARTSSQMIKSIECISDQTRILDTHINDTARGIYEISSNITRFKQEINNQASAVEQSSASVHEMISSLESVSIITNKKLESTVRLVETTTKGEKILFATTEAFKEGVSNKIDSINNMVEIISDISERTNLLAMNAAIEAAHAGDSGKGFAVVADEIRKMAEEATNSSNSISSLISSIVDSISVTDQNMKKTSDAFRSIIAEVSQINVALNEIAINTIELTSSGHEVLDSIYLLNKTSESISMGVNEIENGSNIIKETMSQIKNISNEVLGETKEISIGINDVSDSFDEVATLAKVIGKESKKLTNEVDQFIV